LSTRGFAQKAETIQGGHRTGNLSKKGRVKWDKCQKPTAHPAAHPDTGQVTHSVGHLATHPLNSQTREAIIVAWPLK